MVELLAEIERRVNEENARPKKRYLSPATREAAYAIYVDTLRRRIEARGTENFPTLAGKKLYGELKMTVTVNFDGKVLDTVVDESSGNVTLDRRAQAIVRSIGNFGKFTDAMRKQTDQIVLQSRFKFTRDETIELSSVAVKEASAMDLYCVMGNPVEHSRSPRIHARFAELCGQQMDYGRRLVPLGAFAEGIAAFRREAAERGDSARGCNITVPFKFEAAALAQHTSERALLAQAVNTLRFDADGSIHADNTDGIGLVNDIVRNAGVPLAGKELLLIGAGGAAAGVLGPLLDAGASRIVVANRTVGKAMALVQRHAALALAPRRHARGLGARRSAGRFRRGGQRHRLQPGGRCGAGARTGAAPRRARGRHDVRPCRRRLHGLGRSARRGSARRPRHAGRAGGRSVRDLARRAPARGAGAGRIAHLARCRPMKRCCG
jgi:hypothetical protein